MAAFYDKMKAKRHCPALNELNKKKVSYFVLIFTKVKIRVSLWRKNHNFIFPLFLRGDLGTTQCACQDKTVIVTIFVMKTNQVLRPCSTGQHAIKKD